MLENVSSMEQSVLIDKLVEYTTLYTRFITQGGDKEDINNCKQLLEQLQAEIEKRMTDFSSNTTTTGQLPSTII